MKVHKSVDPRNAPRPDLIARVIQLRNAGCDDEAARLCVTLDQQYHPHYHAQYLFATIARDQGLLTEAIDILRDVCRAKPAWTEAAYNLGHMLQQRGDIAEAERVYRGVVRRDSSFTSAWVSLGNLLLGDGRTVDARAAWARADAHPPRAHETEALANYAHVVLAQGDWSRGWPLYESRWGTVGFAAQVGFRRPEGAKDWHGEPLHGAHIVLFCEQGAGDTIMCLRYRSDVVARGAGHISWIVQPGLVRLVEANFPDDTILRDGDTPDRVDYICPLLSLPLHCGTTVDAVPGSRGYLHVGGEEENADTGRHAPVARGPLLGGLAPAQE